MTATPLSYRQYQKETVEAELRRLEARVRRAARAVRHAAREVAFLDDIARYIGPFSPWCTLRGVAA